MFFVVATAGFRGARQHALALGARLTECGGRADRLAVSAGEVWHPWLLDRCPDCVAALASAA